MLNTFGVGFWKKESGNALTHSKGLTEEQAEHLLKVIKPGTRFMLWDNSRDKLSGQSPDIMLRIFQEKAQPTTDSTGQTVPVVSDSI